MLGVTASGRQDQVVAITISSEWENMTIMAHLVADGKYEFRHGVKHNDKQQQIGAPNQLPT